MHPSAHASSHTPRQTLFQSYFLGGFECATHRRRDGRRLDIIDATAHDTHAAADYAQLQAHGIRTVREGFRWHRIEQRAGQYDFSTARAMVQAARSTGTQVIWDLLHFGWPDDLDPMGPHFVRRFARFARACAAMLRDETDAEPWYVPINEISFLAWGGGDAGWINPHFVGRGFEFKVQLCRAAIEAIEAIREVQPTARIATAEPVIHIVASDPSVPGLTQDAEGHRQAQFQAWDMLSGRLWPQLGGDPKYLDVLGVNFYYNNQRLHGPNGKLLTDRRDPRYRPFREMLTEVHERYGRPVFVAETGIEGEAHLTGIPPYEMPVPADEDARPEWLRYIGAEVRAARSAGVPVEGICLYPIMNHPGWDDDRHCQNGLLDFEFAGAGRRAVVDPLAEELARQQRLLDPQAVRGTMDEGATMSRVAVQV